MTVGAMDAVEAMRVSYRPTTITTLFIGKSAPAGGSFFYDGNNSMLRYMQKAVDAAITSDGPFLDRFKSLGWYLDDLVLTMPVDKLGRSQRRAEWIGACESLAARIGQYRPLAIVTLLLGIESIVRKAAKAAGSDAMIFTVPFPGMSHQGKFHREMVKLIPALPRIKHKAN